MGLAIRTGIFIAGKVAITIFYGLILLPVLILPKLLRHRIMISWCTAIIFWLRITCGVRYEISGLENIGKTFGAKVILSKHQSAWETFMLQTLMFPVATILKKELLNIPIFGWGLRSLQPIAIDRSNPRAALKLVKAGCIDRLNKNVNILLFPEGTRTPRGERGKYARSGADIAIAAGVDVIPVAVDAGKCWPSKTLLKQPGVIHVVIGAPISSANKDSKTLITEVETWIEEQMHRIDPEAYASCGN